jgi:signal transduction histidine kinase
VDGAQVHGIQAGPEHAERRSHAGRVTVRHQKIDSTENSALDLRSGASMQALLDDLVDFNRMNLGLGLDVIPTDIDLEETFANELEQLQGAHPNRQIELTVSGDVRGRWDGPRLQQLLRNLVVNAISHGAQDSPVRVALRGAETEVTLEVVNSGPPIEAAVLSQMFEPLRRGGPQRKRYGSGGLGLGLFIVREIAKGHGGEVEVRSDGGETAFAVRLPRERPEV